MDLNATESRLAFPTTQCFERPRRLRDPVRIRVDVAAQGECRVGVPQSGGNLGCGLSGCTEPTPL